MQKWTDTAVAPQTTQLCWWEALYTAVRASAKHMPTAKSTVSFHLLRFASVPPATTISTTLLHNSLKHLFRALNVLWCPMLSNASKQKTIIISHCEFVALYIHWVGYLNVSSQGFIFTLIQPILDRGSSPKLQCSKTILWFYLRLWSVVYMNDSPNRHTCKIPTLGKPGKYQIINHFIIIHFGTLQTCL